MNEKSLKRKVMAHIYFEYTKNLLRRHPDYFMLLLFVVTSFILVSAQDVFANVPKTDFYSVFNFFKIALRDTSWILQVLIAGFLIRVIISGLRVTYKNIGHRIPLTRLRY